MHRLPLLILVAFFIQAPPTFAQSAINTETCKETPAKWCKGVLEGEKVFYLSVDSMSELSDSEQDRFMTDRILNHGWGKPAEIVEVEGEEWIAIYPAKQEEDV